MFSASRYDGSAHFAVEFQQFKRLSTFLYFTFFYSADLFQLSPTKPYWHVSPPCWSPLVQLHLPLNLLGSNKSVLWCTSCLSTYQSIYPITYFWSPRFNLLLSISSWSAFLLLLFFFSLHISGLLQDMITRGEGARVSLHLHTLGFLKNYLLTTSKKVCIALDRAAHIGKHDY